MLLEDVVEEEFKETERRFWLRTKTGSSAALGCQRQSSWNSGAGATLIPVKDQGVSEEGCHRIWPVGLSYSRPEMFVFGLRSPKDDHVSLILGNWVSRAAVAAGYATTVGSLEHCWDYMWLGAMKSHVVP